MKGREKEDYHELKDRLISNDVREIAKYQVRKDSETGLCARSEPKHQRDLEWQRFLAWSICEYWAWLLWKEQMPSVGKVVEPVLQAFCGKR